MLWQVNQIWDPLQSGQILWWGLINDNPNHFMWFTTSKLFTKPEPFILDTLACASSLSKCTVILSLLSFHVFILFLLSLDLCLPANVSFKSSLPYSSESIFMMCSIKFYPFSFQPWVLYLQTDYPKYTPLLAKILEGLFSSGADQDKVSHDKEASNTNIKMF